MTRNHPPTWLVSVLTAVTGAVFIVGILGGIMTVWDTIAWFRDLNVWTYAVTLICTVLVVATVSQRVRIADHRIEHEVVVSSAPVANGWGLGDCWVVAHPASTVVPELVLEFGEITGTTSGGGLICMVHTPESSRTELFVPSPRMRRITPELLLIAARHGYDHDQLSMTSDGLKVLVATFQKPEAE